MTAWFLVYMRVQLWGPVDGGTADNKKSISLHFTSAERNLKPGGMTFTPHLLQVIQYHLQFVFRR